MTSSQYASHRDNPQKELPETACFRFVPNDVFLTEASLYAFFKNGVHQHPFSISSAVQEKFFSWVKSLSNPSITGFEFTPKIMQSQSIPSFQATFEYSQESRTIERRIIPCKVRPLNKHQPAKGIWFYQCPLQELLKEQKNDYPIEETKVATTCHDCNGRGRVTCGSCHGDREVPCSCGNGFEKCYSCAGRGQEGYQVKVQVQEKCYCSGGRTDRGSTKICFRCNGRGVYLSTDYETRYRNCWRCAGQGQVKCSTCSGRGEVPCSRCDATGRVVCNTCDGRGEIITLDVLVQKISPYSVSFNYQNALLDKEDLGSIQKGDFFEAMVFEGNKILGTISEKFPTIFPPTQMDIIQQCLEEKSSSEDSRIVFEKVTLYNDFLLRVSYEMEVKPVSGQVVSQKFDKTFHLFLSGKDLSLYSKEDPFSLFLTEALDKLSKEFSFNKIVSGIFKFLELRDYACRDPNLQNVLQASFEKCPNIWKIRMSYYSLILFGFSCLVLLGYFIFLITFGLNS